MKTKFTLMCAIAGSMTLIEAGYGSPCSCALTEAGEPRSTHNREPMNLTSNVEFQRIVETQTTLIHHHKHRHKNAHKHHLERKK